MLGGGEHNTIVVLHGLGLFLVAEGSAWFKSEISTLMNPNQIRIKHFRMHHCSFVFQYFAESPAVFSVELFKVSAQLKSKTPSHLQTDTI